MRQKSTSSSDGGDSFVLMRLADGLDSVALVRLVDGLLSAKQHLMACNSALKSFFFIK